MLLTYDNLRQVGVTYRCLRRRVSSISSLLASVAPASTRVTVVLLPVSVTAVASILALARTRHCLVSTEFSAAALQELLATNMVGCLVTSHTHLPALLHQEGPVLRTGEAGVPGGRAEAAELLDAGGAGDGHALGA